MGTFKRHISRLLAHLRKTKEPVILTIDGEATIIVQDVESYQALLVAKEQMKTIEGIRRGIETLKAGSGKTSEDFFKEFFSKHKITEE